MWLLDTLFEPKSKVPYTCIYDKIKVVLMRQGYLCTMYVLLFLISCEKRITVKSTKTITKPVCVRAFGEEGDGPEEAVRDAAQDIPLQDGPGT